MNKIYSDDPKVPAGFQDLLGYVFLTFLHSEEAAADDIVSFMKTAFAKLHAEHSKSQMTQAMSLADFAEYYYTKVEDVKESKEQDGIEVIEDPETAEALKNAKGEQVMNIMAPFTAEVVRYEPKDVFEFASSYFEALNDGEEPLRTFLEQQARSETRTALG